VGEIKGSATPEKIHGCRRTSDSWISDDHMMMEAGVVKAWMWPLILKNIGTNQKTPID
jgi:hypothetical protein